MSPHQHHVSAKPITPTELIPVVVPSIDHQNELMTLCNWLIDRGERIEQGEDILEISLPGIVYDVPAPVSGTLERIDRIVSDRLQPGDVCGWIRCETESSSTDDAAENDDSAGSES